MVDPAKGNKNCLQRGVVFEAELKRKTFHSGRATEAEETAWRPAKGIKQPGAFMECRLADRQESDHGRLIRTQVGLWSNGRLWQVIALGGWKGRDVHPGEETAPMIFVSLLCGQRELMRQKHLDQQ